jgi:hypothetical protein
MVNKDLEESDPIEHTTLAFVMRQWKKITMKTICSEEKLHYVLKLSGVLGTTCVLNV